MMNIKLALLLSISLVVLNNLLGHYYCFSGIGAIPGVALVVTVILAFLTSGLRFYQKVFLIASLIALNDVGLKLYAAGSHDKVGQSWLTLFSIAGILLALSVLVVSAVKDKSETLLHKVCVLLGFPILLIGYIYLTNDLGLGRYYLCN